MKNKYLDFISDEHFMRCIENLYNAYLNAKAKFTKKKFYSNKIDTLKLTFDSKFNNLDEKTLIKAEISRQIDKSINNAIGRFHEEILGGIDGFSIGDKDGYDIKADDDTLFADIKNKYNTLNSSSAENLYQKLEKFAKSHPKSKCYWVQIWATKSFNENWVGSFGDRKYSNPNVFKISGDQFYFLLSGQKDALFQLYKILPKAIDDFLFIQKKAARKKANTALNEIQEGTTISGRSFLDEISFENFGYYLGFDSLDNKHSEIE